MIIEKLKMFGDLFTNRNPGRMKRLQLKNENYSLFLRFLSIVDNAEWPNSHRILKYEFFSVLYLEYQRLFVLDLDIDFRSRGENIFMKITPRDVNKQYFLTGASFQDAENHVLKYISPNHKYYENLIDKLILENF